MSIWTHVAGIIRINDFILSEDQTLDFDEIVGKECLYDSPDEVWADKDANPDKYMPCGSEGTLTKSVWVNPDKSHIAAYTVSVFGDLRDYDDLTVIRDWFKSVCDKVWIRSAILKADCENGETLIYEYKDPDNEENE